MDNRTHSNDRFFKTGILLLFCILLSISKISSAASPLVAVIYQQDKSFSVSIARELAKHLRSNEQSINLIPLQSVNRERLDRLSSDTLIVSLGSETTHSLFQYPLNNPMLSLLISKQSYKTLLNEKPDSIKWTALYIDQPLHRQFSLIQHLLSKEKTIGILLGPYSRSEANSIKAISKRTRQAITTREITEGEQLIPELKSVIDDSGVLLALPDPMVFNKTTIRGILLLSYRENIPMIGFSRAYVKAGAIAAIYSDLQQISDQAYRLIKKHLEKGGLPRSTYYPDDFSVALNRKVARTLDISIEDEVELIRKIKADEARR